MENWIFIASAVLLAVIVATAIVLINSWRLKDKVNAAELVSLYADMLVRAAEQTGKVKDMSGADKKMFVMSLLNEAVPSAPTWVKDAAVEGAVLLLDRTSVWLANKYEDVVGA